MNQPRANAAGRPNHEQRGSLRAHTLHVTGVASVRLVSCSPLSAHLLNMGYTDLTVADISPAALAHTQAELGDAAAQVCWIEADIRAQVFERRYDLWHDRAVFHFMVSTADRESYLDVLRRTLRPGGHLVLATFGPQGPTQCSGLPVQRYGADVLQQVLGEDFQLVSSSLATHRTPFGASQEFLYAHLHRRAAN
jgi:SAM-dependent methyltransferase